MRDIEKLAISKAIKDRAEKEARANLAPGIHNVDTLVRVSGSLTINPDETYIPTAEIPVKAALALFIRYCGITRDAAENALVRAMTEALNREETGILKTMTILEELEEIAIIDDCTTRVMRLASRLPERTRKGKVLTNLRVDTMDIQR